MRSGAVNVAANTNEPGFRGPSYPDGSFEYVRIPEAEPTGEPVPTYGDPDVFELYDRAVPLSTSDAGADPNRVVTDLSEDSGKGPWWRRPLRFDERRTRELLSVADPAALVE